MNDILKIIEIRSDCVNNKECKECKFKKNDATCVFEVAPLYWDKGELIRLLLKEEERE